MIRCPWNPCGYCGATSINTSVKPTSAGWGYSGTTAAGTVVELVCAMQHNDDGTLTPIPLAVMVEGNPFEDFEDPTK